MNILLINHYAGSVVHGMEYRPYYMAKKWIEMGHQVTILTASYSHLRTKQMSSEKDFDISIIDGIRYIVLKTPEYNGNGVSRFFNMLTFVYKVYRYNRDIIKLTNPDVIIGSSTYPLDMLPAKKISKKTKAKLLFEVHDIWPLSPMELGNMSKFHPFIMVMQFGEDYAYKYANRVISMLPSAEEHMLSRGLTRGKFRYIPNGFDISEWTNVDLELPLEYSKKIEEIRNKHRILIGYAGGHNISNALEDLLHAIKIQNDSNIAYCLIGKGTEKYKLEEFAKENQLLNVFFLDAISKKYIPAFLNQMDALYIGWKKKSLYRFGVSPNKLFDYMMAQKPILHAIEAGNDLVAEAKCGISVKPEQPEMIAKGLTEIAYLDKNEKNRLGVNGYKFVLEQHEYTVLAERFIKVMEEEGI